MTENTNQPGQPTPPPAASGYEAPQPAAAPPPPAYGSAPAPGYGAHPGGPSRVTNTMAIVTLIAGIAGLSVVPFIGSIVAVITGPMAEKQIAQTGEDGAQFAKIGKILGWIGVILGGLGLIFAVAIPLIIVMGAAASA